MNVVLELFWRFLLIGGIAFGGGQAAWRCSDGSTRSSSSWAEP